MPSSTITWVAILSAYFCMDLQLTVAAPYVKPHSRTGPAASAQWHSSSSPPCAALQQRLFTSIKLHSN
eukprot:1803864-Pleurochrysis_carterae.AAC.2